MLLYVRRLPRLPRSKDGSCADVRLFHSPESFIRMWLSSFFPSARVTSSEDTYQRLPASDVDVQMYKTTRKPPRFRRRPTLIALASVCSFLAGIGVWLWLFFTGAVGIPGPILHALAKESRLPPLYSRFHQYELQLPQHSLDQASAKTEDVKYFWMANHVQGIANTALFSG